MADLLRRSNFPPSKVPFVFSSCGVCCRRGFEIHFFPILPLVSLFSFFRPKVCCLNRENGSGGISDADLSKAEEITPP